MGYQVAYLRFCGSLVRDIILSSSPYQWTDDRNADMRMVRRDRGPVVRGYMFKMSV